MRTLKLALAAVAAFAFNANAQTAITGMGSPPTGTYQAPIITGSAPDFGFHAGGVAACDGCHVMHNASTGVAKSTTGLGASVAPWTNVTNAYLLQGSDQSSTCLICHSGVKTNTSPQFLVADLTTTAGGTNAPTNRSPGGDFGWIRTGFGLAASPAVRHGHNIAAADYPEITTDALRQAPGGNYTSGAGLAAFACSSCHDPHGRYRMQLATTPNGIKFVGPFTPGALPIAASGSYGQPPTAQYSVGSYRLLAGQNYAPASNLAYPFVNDPPVAVAPAVYNKSETSSEVRVAYGTGMSEWCQNCHTNIHLDGYTTGVAGLRHPAGSAALLHGGQINVYNAYVASGVVNPALTDPYTSLVPFEQGKTKTIGQLVTSTTASILADPQSNVMCLSCHRAHASAFDSMLRWDGNATFLTDGTTYTGGIAGRDPLVAKAGYYDRNVTVTNGTAGPAIGIYQRSLCNKCHGKD